MTILWLDFFYYYLKRQAYIVFIYFHPRFEKKEAKMMKQRRESTPVSIAFSHRNFWGEGVSVHRFHPSYTVRFFIIDLFLTLITTSQVEIWPISCLNERKFRNRVWVSCFKTKTTGDERNARALYFMFLRKVRGHPNWFKIMTWREKL